MVTSHLDERELQLLIVALRYWRAHRAGGNTRRSDPALPPDTVDLLLAKLSAIVPPGARRVAAPDPPEHEDLRADR